MALTAPAAVMQHVTHDTLLPLVERSARWSSNAAEVPDGVITDETLADLLRASEVAGNKSFARVVGSIQAARDGDFSKSIPKIDAAPQAILAFLRHNLIDGWVYKRDYDGHLHPYLVTDVRIETRRGSDRQQGIKHVVIRMIVNGGSSRLGVNKTSVSLTPENITRKKVDQALLDAGLFKETPELKADYEDAVERYRVILTGGFAQQYRYTGIPASMDRWSASTEARTHRKVIHDIDPDSIPAFTEWAPSKVITATPDDDDEDDTGETTGAVPVHTTLKVFDLVTHEFMWVNSRDLAEYKYDHSLREKLILPPDQRELLDILTADIATFTADIIEGKSAGNVILCKGIPGVGKTLSAEVYAELIERPLYSIHSGSLGTTPDSIRAALETAFKRAKRWDAVLLLDEADVFVIERGSDITQNAIVAEFLRTLEYFDGLLFMTTNRANSIDEAIISRCAAIIDYQVPERDNARRIWQVMADNSQTVLPDPLLEELLDGFPKIAPRDIKMLLRLALRVSAHRDEPLSADLFRRCAMFRGLHFETGSRWNNS